MKKIIGFISISTLLIFFMACSDEESSWSAADTCPADGYNVYGMPNRGTFVDERDGQEYSYMTIGNQVWMEDNLNIQSSRSVCYEYNDENCALYGRLYALQYGAIKKGTIDSTYGFLNYDMVDTICPAGWHVPTMREWDTLVVNMDGVGNVKKDRCLSVTKYGNTGYGSSYYIENEINFHKNGKKWWTQTMYSGEGWALLFDVTSDSPNYNYPINQGYVSIRCIKD